VGGNPIRRPVLTGLLAVIAVVIALLGTTARLTDRLVALAGRPGSAPTDIGAVSRSAPTPVAAPAPIGDLTVQPGPIGPEPISTTTAETSTSSRTKYPQRATTRGGPTDGARKRAPTPTGLDPAGAVVADGFETQRGSVPSGRWSVVKPDCQGTGTARIDRAVAHLGKASLRIEGRAGYCNHVFAALDADLAKIGRSVHVRMFVRHRTALPTEHVTFAAFPDAGDGGKDLRIGGQGKALQWNRASNDATLPEQSPVGIGLSRPLPTGAWQCLEVAINGSTGRADTWLNGRLVPGLHVDGVATHDVDGQWQAKRWRPSLTSLKLGWESYSSAADTLWFDDVAVGPGPIGCS
jgi:hypothetical protein